MKKLILLIVALLSLPIRAQEVIRAGIIGLDTSHVVAFTDLLNAANNPPELQGVRIVAAFPGGSPDIASSRDRVAGFTKQLQSKGVEIVDSIPALLEKVDVVLLESVDGRPHLEQVKPVFQAKKKVFIDKPLAGSLADAIAIDMLSKRHNTPWFSSSSLRFSPGIIGMRSDEKVGQILGASAWGPCSLEEHHPDLYWYGVHGCEILYTLMGTGCRTVSRTQTEDYEYVVGAWSDDRIGSFRGLRKGKQDYGAVVFGSKSIAQTGKYEGYKPLVIEIVKFFKTATPPIPSEETIELFAFMEAADESKRQNGKIVRIADVMDKAKEAAKAKVGE